MILGFCCFWDALYAQKHTKRWTPYKRNHPKIAVDVQCELQLYALVRLAYLSLPHVVIKVMSISISKKIVIITTWYVKIAVSLSDIDNFTDVEKL